MRHKVQEADISRKTFIQKIADFLQNVLPSNSPLGTVPAKIGNLILQHTQRQTLTPFGHRLLHYRLRNVKLYARLQKDL